MIVFWRLVLAGLLTDYTFQPLKFYHWKMQRPAGKIVHLTLLFVLSLLLAWPYLNMVWFTLLGVQFKGVVTLVILTALHFLLDFIFEKDVTHKGSMPLVLKVTAHQALSFLAIFVMAPVVDLHVTKNIYPEKAVIVLVFLILVMDFARRVINTYECDFCGVPIDSKDESLMTTMQRIIFYLICLIPGPVFIILCPAWFAVSFYAAKQRILDLSNFSLYFGSAFAVACGIFVRIVLYL